MQALPVEWLSEDFGVYTNLRHLVSLRYETTFNATVARHRDDISELEDEYHEAVPVQFLSILRFSWAYASRHAIARCFVWV